MVESDWVTREQEELRALNFLDGTDLNSNEVFANDTHRLTFGAVVEADSTMVSYKVLNDSSNTIRVKAGIGIAYNVPAKYNSRRLEECVIINFRISNIFLHNLTVKEIKTPKIIDRLLMEHLFEQGSTAQLHPTTKVHESTKRSSLPIEALDVSITIKRSALDRVGVISSDLLGIEIDVREEAIRGNYVRNPVQDTLIGELDKNADSNLKTLYQVIYKVDPDNTLSNYYTSISGLPVLIPNNRSIKALPGLYIAVRCEGEFTKTKHYHLDEVTDEVMKLHGLFYSEAECKRAISPAYVQELEKRNSELKKEFKKAQEELNKIRTSHEILKEETRIKEMFNKYDLSFTKQKAGNEELYDKIKAFALLATTGATIYKLFN